MIRGQKSVPQVDPGIGDAGPDVRVGGEMPGHVERRGSATGLRGDDRLERIRIVHVQLLEPKPGVPGGGGEVRFPPQLQVVDAQHGSPLRQQAIHQMAADESGGPGDETFFHCGTHEGGMKAASIRFVEEGLGLQLGLDLP